MIRQTNIKIPLEYCQPTCYMHQENTINIVSAEDYIMGIMMLY